MDRKVTDTTLFQPGMRPNSGLAGLRALLRDPLSAWPKSLFEGEPFEFRIGPIRSIDTPCPEDAAKVLLHARDAFRRSPVVRAVLGPALGDGLIVADGESWRFQRSVAAPVFRHTELEKLVPVFDATAQKMTARLGPGGARPLLPVLTEATLEIIIESLFGDVALDRDAIAKDITVFLEGGGQLHFLDLLAAPAFVPRPGRRASTAAIHRLRDVCKRVVQDMRRHPGGGSMTYRLLGAQDPDTGAALCDRQMVDTMMTFIGAGHETTSTALSWTLWLLAHRPALQDALLAEGAAISGDVTAADLESLDLHKRVVQEAMRLYPPVVAVPRQVTRPVTIAGRRLSRGNIVNVITAALHRNPAHWPDPDHFDPDRFLPEVEKARDRFAYLPFGGGATMCIGWKLALMETTVLLFRLAQSYRFAPIPDARPPRPVVRITMRPDDGMMLNVLPRSEGVS